MQAAFTVSGNFLCSGIVRDKTVSRFHKQLRCCYQRKVWITHRGFVSKSFSERRHLFRGAPSSLFPSHHLSHCTISKPLVFSLSQSNRSLTSSDQVKGIQCSVSLGKSQSRVDQDPIHQLQVSFASLLQTGHVDTTSLCNLIRAMFPFPIDAFQENALEALSDGQSVVLSAPTGAGKTVVGEMAVYIALCREMRIFYTTPLKALSNQKFYDFKKQFGEHRVGLLTGDITINRDAEIVVMTTEVYRNMLYADSTEAQSGPPPTQNLFSVVFDEFHYLNDRDRGTVWEECVINSPPHVLLVALSATMSNTEDVRDWFAYVQGPTSLVKSDVRPVPLSFSYFDREGITPLFEDVERKRSKGKGRGRGFRRQSGNSINKEEGRYTKLHPKLLRKVREGQGSRNESGPRSKTAGTETGRERDVMLSKYKEISRGRGKGRSGFMELPSFPFVVRGLRKREMLPCIVFIFSRAGCDRAAIAASSEKEPLVSLDEQSEIKARLDSFVAKQPGMVQPERLALALQGIASHHAGLLPLWKICVEEMFQDGLIKVVFATETLAAGINMPARTTVISTLSKRAGEEGIVSLRTSEVLQMAGRAGRRGKDVLGYSVVLKSRKEGPMEAFKVLTAPVDALESKFSPSYGMVLNLLAARPIADARKLVDRSFGNFLRRKQLESQQFGSDDPEFGASDMTNILRERDALESVLRDAKNLVAASDEKSLRGYIKSIERVKGERRALTYLVKQGEAMDAELVEETLTFAPAGTKLLLRERGASKSAGQDRRQRRREYSGAITAAGNGDLGEELRSFYLEHRDFEMDVLEGDESNTGVEEIEAVLLDMHAESAGVLPTFAAVDANGKLRLFNHIAVSQLLFDAEPIDVDVHAPGWSESSLPQRSQWQALGAEQFEAVLPECLSGLVEQIQEWKGVRRDADSSDENGAALQNAESHRPEIMAQRERLEHAKELVRKHELHGRDGTRELLAAKRAIPKIESTLDGRYDPFGNKRRQGKGGTYKRYLKLRSETAQNGEPVESASNSSWDEFMSLVSVLQHYGFIDDSYNVTSLGTLGAKIRSENELWTSLVLMDPGLNDISPVSLGALLGATQMETSRPDVYVSQEVSEEVRRGVSQAAAERVRLFAVQNEHGVDVSIGLDADLMGLVELWASGVTWVELLSNTSLQEGDACRILRRVLDVLRQIQHLPVVGNGLKRNAKRAIALLDRFPVTDDQTYTVRKDERLDDDDA